MKIYRKKTKDGKHELFHLRLQVDGQRRRFLLGTDIGLAKARVHARKKMRELEDDHTGLGTARPVSFGDYVRGYISRMMPKKSMRRDVDILENYLDIFGWGKLPIKSITTGMLEEARNARLNPKKWGRAPDTVHKELQVLKRVFRKAFDEGVLVRSPADLKGLLPSVNKGRKPMVSEDELTRVVRALEAKAPAVLQRVRMAYFSGGRWGEVDKLCWNDVDDVNQVVTWRETKTGETNDTPIEPPMRAILDALPKPVNRSQIVFPPLVANCRLHDSSHAQGVTCNTCYQSARRAWKAALATAKVTDFRFHDLRHLANSALANDGRPQADLKAFCRHSSITMTARYTHLSDQRRRETLASLAKTPAGKILQWPSSGHPGKRRRPGAGVKD